ncbi:hypothetical protein ACP70R_027426 [Stipagrostis hirtigluma subsp. patula]
MESFLAALVFCEAPLDAAFVSSARTAGKGGAGSCKDDSEGALSRSTAAAANDDGGERTREAPRTRGGATTSPSLDGLHCFQTVLFRVD